MSDAPICRCDVFVHPNTIQNPPGLDTIRYRLGDFLQFREALLRPSPDEVELLTWRPTAKGDLALQMLEWWAYVADIFTFYNERIANESYLRTADLPESVKRLIRILGYRPRPGIGATGAVGALLSGPGTIVLPKGFAIQSKPGPGKQPQIFEVDADTSAGLPDAVAADPTPDLTIGTSVLLKGTASAIKSDDRLLLLKRGWAGESTGQAFVTVQSTAPEKDARGRTNTRVTFTASPGLPSTEKVTEYRLLRSTETGGLWSYPTVLAALVITNNTANLSSIARGMARDTPVLFDLSGSVQRLVDVTSYSEVVWFANPDADSTPQIPPKSPTIGIAIPHSVIGFTPDLAASEVSSIQGNLAATVLRFDWRDAGELIAQPATGLSGASFDLTAAPGAAFPPALNARPVLLEDANGHGSSAKATSTGSGAITVIGVTGAAAFKLPVRVLFNLLRVSRGKTVLNEVLGSGDASAAGQEFVLQKSPLTYLQTSDPTNLDGYKSTLRVWVNGVEWTEVASFFGQPPDARIFVTREDEDNKTHVLFGDGINGARLPTGVNNIVAQYRRGSGADVPDPGKLTLITQPLPGLKSIANPVAPGGGADPDSPKRIRQLAPRSILTFGRAVSGDDYEVIATQTPGVARARAYWSFDTVRQRTVITVYVGDNAAAVTATQTALARSADPNRPVVVKQANAVPIVLFFVLVVNPAYQPAAVADAVKTALIDPDAGLFGINRVRIGASVFRSQIEDACLRVRGAVAVHSMLFFATSAPGGGGFFQLFDPSAWHFPGEGGFFQLQPQFLFISAEVASYGA